MRRTAAIALSIGAWGIGIPLAHGVVPWLIAKVGPTFVGSWSWLGLALLVLGALLLAWVRRDGIPKRRRDA